MSQSDCRFPPSKSIYRTSTNAKPFRSISVIKDACVKQIFGKGIRELLRSHRPHLKEGTTLMIIKFKEGTTRRDIDSLRALSPTHPASKSTNPSARRSRLFGVVGDTTKYDINSLVRVQVRSIRSFASRNLTRRSTARSNPPIRLSMCGGVLVGGNNIVVIGGPCAVESRRTNHDHRAARRKPPARRCFEPAPTNRARVRIRFKGLGPGRLAAVQTRESRKPALPIVSELMDIDDLPLFLDAVDVIQSRREEHAKLRVAQRTRQD
ncbi:MAG: hypothetical protein MZU97_21305 [Bacillus subtilis]|nr:hypothetical protein [Bacillus subtilis]